MKKLIILGVMGVLNGCISMPDDPVADDPYYAPIHPEQAPVNFLQTGSLFNSANVDSLYADVKAKRVGDIIEVVLSENTSAQKSVDSSSSKETSAKLDPIFGLASLTDDENDDLTYVVEQESDFAGTGQSEQSNSLSGSISVSVIEVLNNGNLIVRGEKWMGINKGDEFIRLQGIIRPQDVNADNQVDSIKIADARIQYSGTGSLANSQRRGWLEQFLNSSWWPL